jgi:hypothetical protein
MGSTMDIETLYPFPAFLNRDLEVFPLCLPFLYRLTRCEEHPDIENEIITDEIEREEFEEYDEEDTLPDTTEIRKDKPYRHHEDITRWVQNAITEISLSNSRFSITIDDNRRIFEDFPTSFEEKCDEKSPLHRDFFRKGEKPIKEHTVNHVWEWIDIRDTLRVFTSPDISIPPTKFSIRSENRTSRRIFYGDENCGDSEETQEWEEIFFHREIMSE